MLIAYAAAGSQRSHSGGPWYFSNMQDHSYSRRLVRACCSPCDYSLLGMRHRKAPVDDYFAGDLTGRGNGG